jgi:signal peptidase I
MEDTIMTHDRLIGARFSYWFSEPERGDIVIFHYPVEEDRIYIKRVIGLPGETVRIEDGKIFINDSAEPLKEGYLKEAWDVMNTDFTFVVPADSYLMLGDNRNWSEDARYWADNAMNEGLADTWEEAMDYSYVRKNKILGKAIFTYFRKFRILQHGTWYE